MVRIWWLGGGKGEVPTPNPSRKREGDCVAPSSPSRLRDESGWARPHTSTLTKRTASVKRPSRIGSGARPASPLLHRWAGNGLPTRPVRGAGFRWGVRTSVLARQDCTSDVKTGCAGTSRSRQWRGGSAARDRAGREPPPWSRPVFYTGCAGSGVLSHPATRPDAAQRLPRAPSQVPHRSRDSPIWFGIGPGSPPDDPL